MLTIIKNQNLSIEYRNLNNINPNKRGYFDMSWNIVNVENNSRDVCIFIICQSVYFQIKQMEKSMVQELNVLTYSTVFNSRPSFISTHISDPQIHQLRRSRIQNLPGYRKQDLSNRINFVVVFQTIEIQRLSQQIETLRIKAKDWERQKLNYQNYQVQIRELTQRCHMYELQREGMESQAQKMKIFCERLFRQFEQYKLKYGQGQPGLKQKYNLQKQRSQQLQAEIDKWRNRCTSMERSKMKELEDIRLQFEAKRKSSINREIKEVTIKYENQLSNLTSELRKVREESDWRASENQRLQQLLNGFNLREHEVKQIEDKIYQYENRLVMLSQQNYRLNELLRWKVDELQKIKINQKQLKVKIDSFRTLEEEVRTLRGQIGLKNKQLQQMRAYSSRYKTQVQQLRLQSQKLIEYQSLADKSSSQIQRLNSIIHSKINELDQTKNSLRISQTKLNAINNASQKQFAIYEQKMMSYSKQLQRLGVQLKNRISENENYKVKCGELEKQINRLQVVQNENKDLKNQLSGSMKKLQEFKNKIHLLEESVTLMHEIEMKIQTEEQIKQELLSQREKLNERIRSLTLQLQTVNQKMVSLQAQCRKYNNLQVELKQYQTKIAFMTTELDRINSELQMRIGELHQLRQNFKTINNSKNIFQNIELKLVQNLRQMETLVLELDNSRRQNDKLHNDNMNLELSFKKLQGQIISINNEKEEATRLLKEKNIQIQKLNKQIEGMTQKVAMNRELSQLNQQFMRKNQMLKNNYEQLELRFKNQTKRSENFSIEVEKLSTQLMEYRQQPKISAKLVQEISFLRRGHEEKNITISNMTKRIEVMENLLRTVKQRYSIQMQISQDLQRRVESASQKISIFEGLIDMINRYSEELNRVTEQNIQLQSTKRILDIQMCESMKVVSDSQKVIVPPKQLWTTFGQQCVSIYQNESISNKVPQNQQDFAQNNQNLYTFKEVAPTRVTEFRSQDRVEQKEEKQPSQRNSLHEARETTSMASSFINTLVSKQSVGRFQKAGVAQFQSVNNPNFANIAISKMRYVSNQPTSPSRSSSYYMSPSNVREQEVRYVAIDSQVDEGNQGYQNPFQIIQHHQQHQQNVQQPYPQPQYVQAVKLENAGVKRVTSQTHFVNYPGMRVQTVVVNQSPVAQQLQIKRRDIPNIRVLQAAQSLNIVNSTKNTLQPGAKNTMAADPSKLYPTYRQ